MGGYVDVGGSKTWYEEHGAGDPLVLLHGGLVTNETWGLQIPDFSTRFRVIAPERRGHGHTPDVEGPFSYDAMAADTIAFLDQIVGGPAHLVGWSDGGVVGMLVATARPDLVRKLVAIGANFDTDGVSPEAAAQLLAIEPDSEDMAMPRMLYEAASPDGPEHWPVIIAKFKEMAAKEPHIPVEALGRIGAPTLVVVGDDDLVTLEHAAALYRAVPNAQLAVLPGASHFVAMEKAGLLNGIVLDFLEKEPAPTMMPIRRAGPAH